MTNDTATFGNQYLRALAIQGRVLNALILREVKTRFWKNRLGYVWAVVEPVTHIAVWFVIISILAANPFADQSRRLIMLTTGMVPYLTFRNIASFIEGAISSNQALLNFPVVRHLDLILARFLLEAATMAAVSVIIIYGAVFFGIAEPPRDPVGCGLALGCAMALGLGFGMCNAVFTILSNMYKKVLDVVSRLLYFVSGVMFTFEAMPEDLKRWLIWIPALHVVENFRESFFALYQTSAASVSYILLVSLGMGLAGIIGMRIAGARLNDQ